MKVFLVLAFCLLPFALAEEPDRAKREEESLLRGLLSALRQREEPDRKEEPEKAGRDEPEKAGRQEPEKAGRQEPEKSGREEPEKESLARALVSALAREEPDKRDACKDSWFMCNMYLKNPAFHMNAFPRCCGTAVGQHKCNVKFRGATKEVSKACPHECKCAVHKAKRTLEPPQSLTITYDIDMTEADFKRTMGL